MNLKYGVAIFLYVFITNFISCIVAFKSGVRSGYFRGKADGIRVGVTRG